jgi:two-component system response regulator FixJ
MSGTPYPAPIFIISRDNSIDLVVEAIKNGAFDYIVKPFYGRSIVSRIGFAISTFAKRAPNGKFINFSPNPQLTTRESEVLAQILGGASNKEASRQLSISSRTIEVHRARIMRKLGARNASDLMRIAFCISAIRNDRSLAPAPERGGMLMDTRAG